MSLIAWYPLNGDTLDYSGNENHLIDNSSGQIVESLNGKIGKCYERKSLNNGYGYMNSKYNINLTKDFTMACWAYVTNCHSGTANGLVTNHSYAHNTGAGITVREMSPSDFRISCNTGSGSGRTFNTYYGTTNIKDKWSHLIVRFEKSSNNLSLWVNGSKEYEITYSMVCADDTLALFAWSTSYLTSAVYRPASKLNDVRIYDHALSTKEIKELYKTKILHYTFDDFQEPTENEYAYPDFNTSSANGGWSHWGAAGSNGSCGQNTDSQFIYGNQTYSHWIANGATATGNYLLYQSPVFEGGYRSVQAVICMEDKSEVTNDKVFPVWNARNGGIPNSAWTSIENISGTYFYLCKAEGISQDGTDDLVGFYIKPGLKAYFSQTQLEQKDHVTPFTPSSRPGIVKDISGYNNDTALALSTTPKWTDDSRIGRGAYGFNGVNQGIHSSKSFSIGVDELTISAWINPNGTHSSDREIVIQQNGNFYLTVIPSQHVSTYWYNTSIEGYHTSNAKLELNRWSLITAVWDGVYHKIYINGMLDKQISVTTPGRNTHPSYNISIGYEPTNSRYFNGLIDDVRIYATALSDEDIMELYKTRMNVDDKGNLFVNGINEPYNHLNPTDFFRNVNDPASQTPMPEVVDGRNTWSVYPAWFHPNRALNNVFKENTSYDIQITFKHHTEYLGNYVAGGFQFNFTDGSSHNLITTGNSDWKTLKYITPSSKTLMNIGVYYYTSFRVYIDDSSYIREYIPTSLSDKGILNTTKVASTSLPIRYVRDYINGSNVNTGHHWVELQAIDGFGSNIAFGKTSTSPLLTDGSTATDPYYSTGLSSPDGRYVEVDLGAVHDIKEVKVWHYWHDGRTYYNTKTEVSEDGVNWITIFDSAIEGTYPETVHGHTIQCRPQSFSMRENGTIYARNVYDSY